MLSKYVRWSDPEKRNSIHCPFRLGQSILLLSLTTCTLLLFYILMIDSGKFPFWFQQLHQSACSQTPETSTADNFLGTQLRHFNSPQNSHSEFGEQYSLLEEAHMADKGGFLRLREPSGRVGYYGVSMYHQLHCLKMLRDAIEGKHSEHGHKQREVIDDQVAPDHLIHCLDYMSQAVVCAADDTVEPARIKKLPDGYHIAIIDGAEAVHHCRNSRALSKMVKDSESNPISIENLEPGVTVAELAG